MERREWLDGLKEGDMVIRSHGYGLRTHEIMKVQRCTSTQIHLPRGEKYRRESGQIIGSSRSYAIVELLEPTPERTAEIRRKRLASALASNTAWESLPLETLEAVYRLVTPAKD